MDYIKWIVKGSEFKLNPFTIHPNMGFMIFKRDRINFKFDENFEYFCSDSDLLFQKKRLRLIFQVLSLALHKNIESPK
jgi:hypothetical protein